MDLKTQLVTEENLKQMEKDPRSKVRPVAPGAQRPMLEPIVIGGVAFYLDHENLLVIPMEPTQLPASGQISKSPSKQSISKVQSRVTSYQVSPKAGSRSPSLRKVSFNQEY